MEEPGFLTYLGMIYLEINFLTASVEESIDTFHLERGQNQRKVYRTVSDVEECIRTTMEFFNRHTPKN